MKMTTKVPVFSGSVAALLLLGGYGTALGQGTITFLTYNGTNFSLGEVFQHGGVTPAANGVFSAELFGSTNGPAGTYIAISPVTTFSLAFPGYVNYGTLTLPSQPGYVGGSTLWYELEVWTLSAGSYATAQTINGDQYGISLAESLVLGGGIYFAQQPNLFPNLTLNLTSVPEPATLALVGLGGLSLMLFRRKNS